MNYINNVESVTTMLEESTALLDCYFERVFESESINDVLGAAHWYADAVICLVTKTPR